MSKREWRASGGGENGLVAAGLAHGGRLFLGGKRPVALGRINHRRPERHVEVGLVPPSGWQK